MKITDIEVAYLKIPQIAMEANGNQDTAVILVHTDEGITGLGEADSAPTVVKAIIDAPRSHSVMVGLKEVLIGENPLDIERLWRKMYHATMYFGRRGAVIHAMSGIDIALWDIKGKVLNTPLYSLLGGSNQAKIRAYSSALFGADGVETSEKAAMFKEQGYTAFKFGWKDFGKAEKTDRAHIEGVRKAVGPDAPIMFDVGWAYDSGGPEWDVTTAIRRAKIFAEYDIFWLEEPLHPDDLDGYGKLSDASPVRIAAGEELATIHEFRDLIERGRVHVLQPDVSRVGGVTETMRIAALAASHNRPIVPHHYSSGILGAVSVHINASIPNGLFQEWPAEGSELNTALVDPAITIDKNGFIVIPEGPGLGVELNKEIFEKYRVN